MKLLVNAVGAAMGGAARHLPLFVDALAATEPTWDLSVCVSPGQERLVPACNSVRALPVGVRSGPERLRWEARGLSRVVRRVGAACVLNVTNHGSLVRCGPSVLYQRNALYFDPSWVRRLGPRGRLAAMARREVAYREMAKADVVITPTQAMADFLQSWSRAPRNMRHVVVPHAVDAGQVLYAPKPLATLDDLTLGVISHPAPHKGIETAVRVLAALAAEGRNPRLLLTIDRVGYAEPFQRYVEGIVGLAEVLGVRDRVHLAGATDDVQSVYDQCDVVVVPSLTESFGFPLVEAMARGMPVLASAIPASMEVAGEFAAWFPPGDHESATEALRRLASTARADARATLDRARKRTEELTWDRNAQAVASVIRSCVEGTVQNGRRRFLSEP